MDMKQIQTIKIFGYLDTYAKIAPKKQVWETFSWLPMTNSLGVSQNLFFGQSVQIFFFFPLLDFVPVHSEFLSWYLSTTFMNSQDILLKIGARWAKMTKAYHHQWWPIMMIANHNTTTRYYHRLYQYRFQLLLGFQTI